MKYYLENKLLSEQPETGFVNADEYDKLSGYQTILTPNDKFIYVPNGTKVLQKIETGKGNKLKNFSLGYGGNEQTDKWVPKDFSSVFPINSVISFKLPNGDEYSSSFSWPEFDSILKKSIPDREKFLEFYSLPADPKSMTWAGYTNDSGRPYVSPKQPNTGFFGLIKRNWVLLAQIAVSIAVGILTGGQSLIIQAIAQLGVDVTFAIKQLVEGDKVGALMSVVIGMAPVIGRFSKFGTSLPIKFLKKYGEELSKINDVETLVKFYNKLPEGQEKVLFSRVLKQTPNELKLAYNEGLKNVAQNAVKDKIIQLEKIPVEQKLWWKQMIVEPATGLAAGVPAGQALAKHEESKAVEELLKKLTSDKPVVYTQEDKEKALAFANTIDDD